jgi:GR25 family glycosyltransferase involved in LPS biosynthesis
MSKFQTLVINVSSNKDRRDRIEERLNQSRINFSIVKATETHDISTDEPRYLTAIAESIWKSHLNCLSLAAELSSPTLILEDDAVISFQEETLQKWVDIMKAEEIDFLQLGFLNINLVERISIKLRNFYNFFTRYRIFPSFFLLFGFKEVGRATNQFWRKKLPKDFVVNDIRYGAHCYLVSPKFAEKISRLNSPAFLPADDFYVALGGAKSFKMIRLKKSWSSQDNSPSAVSARFLLK